MPLPSLETVPTSSTTTRTETTTQIDGLITSGDKLPEVTHLPPTLKTLTNPPSRRKIAAIVITHATIDFFSCLLIPILTILEGRLSLTPTQGAVLVGVGSISSGLIQPVVALISDRFNIRWLGTLGMLLCVISFGSIGYAHSFTALLLIQIVGSAGSGAFHPVAAAAMGQLTARKRSLGISVFFLAGMIGGIAGNALTPSYVRTLSVESLAYFIAPGLVATAILAWAVHGTAHRAHDAAQKHASRSDASRASAWRGIAILYAGNALRFTVNMMLVQLLVRWAEDAALKHAAATVLTQEIREQSASINGPMQASMQVGMGIAGLALSAILTRKNEKLALILGPLVGAAIIMAFPHMPTSVAFVMAIGAGMAYAGLIPTTISMAQRFLPHRTTMASAIMLGGAWAVAAAGPSLAQNLLGWVGLNWSFAITGGLLAISGLVSFALPHDAEG